MRRILIAIVIFVTILGGLTGCGKKGNPETPKQPIPPAIR